MKENTLKFYKQPDEAGRVQDDVHKGRNIMIIPFFQSSYKS